MFLYTCLSAKLTNKYESNIIKFQRNLYAETEMLGVTGVWVYGAGPWSGHSVIYFNIVNKSMIRDLVQCHLLYCHSFI